MPHQSEPLSWPHVPLASTPCHAALWVNVFFCFFVAPNVLLYHYNDVCRNEIQKKNKNTIFFEQKQSEEFWLQRTINWEWSNFVKNICSLTKRCVLWQNLQQMKIGKKHLFSEFVLPVNTLFGQIESTAASNTSFPQASIIGATLELNFPSSSDWYQMNCKCVITWTWSWRKVSNVGSSPCCRPAASPAMRWRLSACYSTETTSSNSHQPQSHSNKQKTRNEDQNNWTRWIPASQPLVSFSSQLFIFQASREKAGLELDRLGTRGKGAPVVNIWLQMLGGGGIAECWTPFKTSKESFPLDSLHTVYPPSGRSPKQESRTRQESNDGAAAARLQFLPPPPLLAYYAYYATHNSLSFSHWFSFHFHVFLPPLAPSYHTRSPVVSCSISCLCFSDSGSCTSGQQSLQSFCISAFSTTLSTILFCHPPPWPPPWLPPQPFP